MTIAKFLISVSLNDWKKHFLSVLLHITPSTHQFTHGYCQVIISLKIKFFVRHCIVFTDPEQIHSKTHLLYTVPGNPSQDKVVWKASKGGSQICKALLPGHLIFIIVFAGTYFYNILYNCYKDIQTRALHMHSLCHPAVLTDPPSLQRL